MTDIAEKLAEDIDYACKRAIECRVPIKSVIQFFDHENPLERWQTTLRVSDLVQAAALLREQAARIADLEDDVQRLHKDAVDRWVALQPFSDAALLSSSTVIKDGKETDLKNVACLMRGDPLGAFNRARALLNPEQKP
jgi:hypothetical protein